MVERFIAKRPRTSALGVRDPDLPPVILWVVPLADGPHRW